MQRFNTALGSSRLLRYGMLSMSAMLSLVAIEGRVFVGTICTFTNQLSASHQTVAGLRNTNSPERQIVRGLLYYTYKIYKPRYLPRLAFGVARIGRMALPTASERQEISVLINKHA